MVYEPKSTFRLRAKAAACRRALTRSTGERSPAARRRTSRHLSAAGEQQIFPERRRSTRSRAPADDERQSARFRVARDESGALAT